MTVASAACFAMVINDAFSAFYRLGKIRQLPSHSQRNHTTEGYSLLTSRNCSIRSDASQRPQVRTNVFMSKLKITAGPFTFDARLETEAAPKTCAAFLKHMPFKSQVVHVRWSGEAVWIPLGDLDFGVTYENHTSYPAPGQIILYPGGISETEICSPTVACGSPARWGSLPAIISSRSRRAWKTSRRSARWRCGRARRISCSSAPEIR